ncbi:MAG: hypothetical protein ACP5D5_01475 [Acidithiobacillus sp.]|uniref:hypothetical protein n=1 Tax=Acidithiobacillus sp. TaxID=1872118 RepID=UPI003D02F7C1
MAGPRARAFQSFRIGLGVWLSLLLVLVPFLHEHLGTTSTAGWHWHLHLGSVLTDGSDPVDQQLHRDQGPSDGATIGIDALLERPAQEIPANPIAQGLPLYLSLILVLSCGTGKPRASDWSRHSPPRYRHRPGLPPQALAPPRH